MVNGYMNEERMEGWVEKWIRTEKIEQWVEKSLEMNRRIYGAMNGNEWGWMENVNRRMNGEHWKTMEQWMENWMEA